MINKLSIDKTGKSTFVDDFVKKNAKLRAGSRDLALAGLVYRFCIENNLTAHEVELCERTEWKDNSMEITWFVRKRNLSYDI